MRVLGVPGRYARKRFYRSLPLPAACGAAAVAALSSGHPVTASILGALSAALLRRALAWRRGAEGEARVSRVLEEADLPGWVVNNVVLWRPQGDLDHVVLLPWGVFVLETKSGRVLPGHLRQAHRKAAALSTYLRRRGHDPPVRPLVVRAGGPAPATACAGAVPLNGLVERLRIPGPVRIHPSEIPHLARRLLGQETGRDASRARHLLRRSERSAGIL